MAYREEYNRSGATNASHNTHSAWQDLMESLKEIVEHYQHSEAEHNNRSYVRRYDGGSIGGTMYDDVAYRSGYHGDGMDHGGDYHVGYGRRYQKRNAKGQYTRISISPEDMARKEELGRTLMEQYGPEWVFEKITKEASELIGAVSKRDKYEMMKEFSELCILMAGMESEVSEEMITEACNQASEYYMKKISSPHRRREPHGYAAMTPLHRAYYGYDDIYDEHDMYM